MSFTWQRRKQMRRIQPKVNQFHLHVRMEKLPPLGFVPLLLSHYFKKAAAGSSASHQPRTTSSDHSNYQLWMLCDPHVPEDRGHKLDDVFDRLPENGRVIPLTPRHVCDFV